MRLPSRSSRRTPGGSGRNYEGRAHAAGSRRTRRSRVPDTSAARERDENREGRKKKKKNGRLVARALRSHLDVQPVHRDRSRDEAEPAHEEPSVGFGARVVALKTPKTPGRERERLPAAFLKVRAALEPPRRVASVPPLVGVVPRATREPLEARLPRLEPARDVVGPALTLEHRQRVGDDATENVLRRRRRLVGNGTARGCAAVLPRSRFGRRAHEHGVELEIRRPERHVTKEEQPRGGGTTAIRVGLVRGNASRGNPCSREAKAEADAGGFFDGVSHHPRRDVLEAAPPLDVPRPRAAHRVRRVAFRELHARRVARRGERFGGSSTVAKERRGVVPRRIRLRLRRGDEGARRVQLSARPSDFGFGVLPAAGSRRVERPEVRLDADDGGAEVREVPLRAFDARGRGVGAVRVRRGGARRVEGVEGRGVMRPEGSRVRAEGRAGVGEHARARLRGEPAREARLVHGRDVRVVGAGEVRAQRRRGVRRARGGGGRRRHRRGGRRQG